MKLRVLALGTALAAFGAVGVAQATPTNLNGSLGINDLFTGAKINFTQATSLSLGTITAGAAVGDFQNAAPPITSLTLSDFTIQSGANNSLTVTGSQFGTFTSTSETIDNRLSNTLTLYFLGTYTPAFGNYNPNETASLYLQINENGGSTSSQSFSVAGTFAAPPADNPTSVPEPASLALLGTGLIGLGLVRRKKPV